MSIETRTHMKEHGSNNVACMNADNRKRTFLVKPILNNSCLSQKTSVHHRPHKKKRLSSHHRELVWDNAHHHSQLIVPFFRILSQDRKIVYDFMKSVIKINTILLYVCKISHTLSFTKSIVHNKEQCFCSRCMLACEKEASFISCHDDDDDEQVESHSALIEKSLDEETGVFQREENAESTVINNMTSFMSCSFFGKQDEDHLNQLLDYLCMLEWCKRDFLLRQMCSTRDQMIDKCVVCLNLLLRKLESLNSMEQKRVMRRCILSIHFYLSLPVLEEEKGHCYTRNMILPFSHQTLSSTMLFYLLNDLNKKKNHHHLKKDIHHHSEPHEESALENDKRFVRSRNEDDAHLNYTLEQDESELEQLLVPKDSSPCLEFSPTEQHNEQTRLFLYCKYMLFLKHLYHLIPSICHSCERFKSIQEMLSFRMNCKNLEEMVSKEKWDNLRAYIRSYRYHI